MKIKILSLEVRYYKVSLIALELNSFSTNSPLRTSVTGLWCNELAIKAISLSYESAPSSIYLNWI